MKLRKSAEAFWGAFDHYLHDPVAETLFPGSTERLRFNCLLGFTALDATLMEFWKQEILPEWAELLSLANGLLHDGSALDGFLQATHPVLNRSQWVATLRFISNTSEPKGFSPSFTDLGVLAMIWGGSRSQGVKFAEVVNSLFKMQKIRTACIQTGRDFSDLMGFEGIKLLEAFRSGASALSPFFADYAPASENQKQSRAA